MGWKGKGKEVGADRNDALDTRWFTGNDKDMICNLLDCIQEPLISQRWPLSNTIYESVGISNEFVIYPGVTHTITTEMFNDLLRFFEAHRPPPNRANPAIFMLLLDDK
ncbi:MAG: hypothetical protein GX654_00320 [Desulfatiglans sp.]|nr:hypothetical protein [Desulfatiglans sp.]